MRKSWRWYYKNVKLDIVNNYTYLGTPLYSTGNLIKTADFFYKRGKSTISPVISILSKARSDSWSCKLKLFNAIIASTTLYGCEIWGLGSEHIVEKVQLFYFKKILNLPMNTPSYILRLEIGKLPIEYDIFTYILKYWIKLLLMKDSRYPKIMYNLLLQENDVKVNKNWVHRLKDRLCILGFNNIWISQNPKTIANEIVNILNRYSDILWQNDICKTRESEKFQCYINIYNYIKFQPQNYILYNLPINVIRLICQARIGYGYFRTKDFYCKLETEGICQLCNIHENEDLYHLLFNCKITKNNVALKNMDRVFNYRKYLKVCTKENAIILYNLIYNSLKKREFLLNDIIACEISI